MHILLVWVQLFTARLPAAHIGECVCVGTTESPGTGWVLLGIDWTLSALIKAMFAPGCIMDRSCCIAPKRSDVSVVVSNTDRSLTVRGHDLASGCTDVMITWTMWESVPWAQRCIFPKPFRVRHVSDKLLVLGGAASFHPSHSYPFVIDRLSQASLEVSGDHNWSITVLPLTHLWTVWKAPSDFLRHFFFF